MIPFPVDLTLVLLPGWLAVGGLLALVTVLALLATTAGHRNLAWPAVVVVATAWLLVALGVQPSPLGIAGTIIPLLLVLLAVIGGGGAATLVLHAATRPGDIPGEHGGIMVDAPTTALAPAPAVRSATGNNAAAATPTREVLRGGTTIGYLERIVVVAAVLLGRWELLAALIAVKGLGRFRDLDAGAATERFIIGTLVSLLWAGACTALIIVV